MNTNQTIEKLKSMRLHAMAQMYLHHIQNNLYSGCTPDEYLSVLVDHQWEERQNNKIQQLMKQANFRQKASIADVDFTTARNLEKNMFNRLAMLDFIAKKENVIITGASGVGKSYLAQALGHQACLMGIKTQYFITSRLFGLLKLAKVDGTYQKELSKLLKNDLLILDDFGLKAFDNHAREALLDIIEDRYSTKSTIISSQIPVSAWHEIIDRPTRYP